MKRLEKIAAQQLKLNMRQLPLQRQLPGFMKPTGTTIRELKIFITGKKRNIPVIILSDLELNFRYWMEG